MYSGPITSSVLNRGRPPESFLDALINWGKKAPSELFEANDNDADIYAYIHPILGPWANLLHRRAAMLEVMRVHAGFESSWNWNEGVDRTNKTSMLHIEGQETGIFQVSFDSTYLNHGAMKEFAVLHGIGTAGSFIDRMKNEHDLALEYYARLVRFNVQWAGPIKRHEIDGWLRLGAVTQFRDLLT